MNNVHYCAECNTELVEKTKYFVCFECGYSEKKHVWYQELLQERFWWEPVFNEFPYVIKEKYLSIHTNIGDGQIPAAWLMIRDLYEMTLKLPFLLLISEKTNSNELPYDLIFRLTSKPLSLGLWEEEARRFSQTQLDASPASIILQDILEVYKKKGITSWRNDKIGHGAFSSQELEYSYKQDLDTLLTAITAHFKNNHAHYQNIHIQLIDDKLYLIKDHQEIPLYPFMASIENNVYLFDSYYARTNKTALLDYVSAKKRKRLLKEMEDLYKAAKTYGEISTIDYSAESTMFSSKYIDLLDGVDNRSTYYDFTFIKKKLSEYLRQYSKGIFALKMEGGMGKTTLVKSLDPFSKRAKPLSDDIEIRAFYIHNTYANTPHYFAISVLDLLRKEQGNSAVMGKDLTSIIPHSSQVKQELAMLLKKFAHYYGKKLLLIIDGLDEIPVDDKLTIFDMIPDEDMLAENVYILVTTRPEQQATKFLSKKVQGINITEAIDVSPQTKDYREILHQYVKNSFQSMTEAEIAQILTIAEGKFLNLEIIRRIYQNLNVHALQDSESILNIYLDTIAKHYTEMYFDEIAKLLAVLAISPYPLSLREMSRLIGEDEINFKLLYYLAEVKGLWQKESSYKNNLISLQRKEYKDFLVKRFSKTLSDFCEEWLEEMSEPALTEMDDEQIIIYTVYMDAIQHFAPYQLDALTESSGFNMVEKWIYETLPNKLFEAKHQEFHVLQLMERVERVLCKGEGFHTQRRLSILIAKMRFIMDLERSEYFQLAYETSNEVRDIILEADFTSEEESLRYFVACSYVNRIDAYFGNNEKFEKIKDKQTKLLQMYPQLKSTREGVECVALDYLTELKQARGQKNYELCILIGKKASSTTKRASNDFPELMPYYVQMMTYIASSYRHLSVNNTRPHEVLHVRYLRKSLDYYEKLRHEIHSFIEANAYDRALTKVMKELQNRLTHVQMELAMVYKLMGQTKQALACIEVLLQQLEALETMGMAIDTIRKLKAFYNRALIYYDLHQYEWALLDLKFVEEQLIAYSKMHGVIDQTLFQNHQLLKIKIEELLSEKTKET